MLNKKIPSVFFSNFRNLSSIMLNVFDYEPPKASPHWPGIGRYIGHVKDGGLNIDRQPWQSRRVYNDEIKALNKWHEIW